MSSRITGDIIDALLHCRLKAHFQLRGERGTPSEYEKLQIEQRGRLLPKAFERIRSDCGDAKLLTDLSITSADLRKGAAFILGASQVDDRYAVHFDALRKIDEPSALGSFQYEPAIFCATPRVTASDRQRLAVRAVLLARFQGAFPNGGTAYFGPRCLRTSIRFGSMLAKAEALLRDAERIQRAEVPPKLVLNDHCRICAFRERCHAQAVREDNLTLLRGLGDKTIKRYARSGILTLTQLAHTFRPRRRGKRSDHPFTQRDHALHALAIRDKTVYVLGSPELRTAEVRIFVDMEGDPDKQFIYLIGLVVCERERVERHSFWADNEKAEDEIFARFLEVVSRYDAPCLYSYGHFERTFLERMRRKARRKNPIDRILSALTNVLKIIYPHFYFPTYSNGLKEIAVYLGHHWSDPDASGIMSIVWRRHWEITGDAAWKLRLIQYNLEDCEALRRVCNFISQPPPSEMEHKSGGKHRVRSVAELDKLSRTTSWSKLANPDFEFVNKRAYFDYQQRHVFVREKQKSSRKRGPTEKRRRWQNRDLRVTHRIKISAARCPHCKSTHITSLSPKQRPKGLQRRRKRAIDLVFTPGAIRRKVIEFKTAAYRCEGCHKCFVPERYDRLKRYFHGLMCWFAYQHITHRLGIKSLAALFYETFGVRINFWEFADFRHLLVCKYRETYNKLLKQLLDGPVLYIDETEIKLKDGEGYVWVLASNSATIYMFRPSREGGFLRPLLRDFKGVLVSDFFSAYDGLPCVQQRCLIHLMRDLNRAILDNPFDQEVQSITTPFGVLLRSIVTTIDQRGLKQRHLQTHIKAADSFFDAVAERVYDSEASKALQQRLLRNRERLFTFLRHDGVSWNNNLAENAIKHVSTYRDNVRRSIKAEGLSEYLLLLSLFQSCRVMDISFLKFLLSLERDIGAFATGKRRRRRAARIEIYPKGYLPPSIVSLRRGKTRPTNKPGAIDSQ
ncbi:TM0106 family RecB-like putative nuclease [Bradyrhizobium sp. HKCCYLRH2015]|uniref:TM0106 family RecB-like putative nuclease n=1 Tax=Bradyrhizobium sp. HKCCYLRH2015 TaxID=3420742 RepID=UPI003EC0E4DF